MEPKKRAVTTGPFSVRTRTVQSLNARIALGGEDAKKVAASYLKSKGLVK